ncbi:tetratricopeptide repeat protein [Luteimonas yindakuii]|uniref:Tetratricopeptide repeat protein n=1 Tax=Luteimonas yindakuii TaxID=2565782 RepID=A0A4Z1R601_9GAMM|nr:winged helix-turn-helix domain-containing protein [Luteimonas yindakuii]TKS54880.1 tetratricopeptide repeat protein [Luteimonas yindakuii]
MTPTQDAHARHYRFGPFRLDTQTRELQRDGAAVVLTAKAFDVLVVLVEHRGRVVGRDELLSTVWAGRVVEENNLAQAIGALRRAFGTDGQDHRYIVTVPGRGYRFVADVEVGAEGETPPAHAVAPVAAARWRPLLLAGIPLLMAVTALAWWWTERQPTAESSVAAASASAPPLSLAVLPFRSLPVETRDELLELGMADTLITRFSGSPGLRVRPLSSSQRFAGVAQDPLEAARQLGVDYVVEGTAQRRGDAVKVNARLLAADGSTRWSGSFDARIGRVFVLQDRIADALADALEVSVAAPAHRSPCDGDDVEAYRHYIAGQYRLSRPSALRARQALEEFGRVLERDPGCARAYAGMSQAWRTLVATADVDPAQVFPRARALAERALALDPRLPEAHLARAWIAFWYDWDWAAAEAAFRRAIELNPGLADAHFGLAHLLSNTGRADEAAVLAREAMALDPLSPVIHAIGGWFVAPPGEAAAYMDRALELDPDYWLALLMRGASRAAAGDPARGLADLERARVLCGDCSHALVTRGMVAARAGDRELTLRILRTMEARDREGYWPASTLATLHNALGDAATALDLLERAWRERDVRMVFLKADEPARWPNLREEPRYRALVQRMGFADSGVPGSSADAP